MKLIVAVYDHWGIGRNGTQPIALTADRKFFREQTKGALVIAGRKTIEDFPGKKPLPGRVNICLTRGNGDFPGFTVCHTPEEALALAREGVNAFVIGGGSIYRQFMPFCDTAIVTRVHCSPECDTFFPDLDRAPDWYIAENLLSGEENGIGYEMIVYKRTGKAEVL